MKSALFDHKHAQKKRGRITRHGPAEERWFPGIIPVYMKFGDCSPDSADSGGLAGGNYDRNREHDGYLIFLERTYKVVRMRNDVINIVVRPKCKTLRLPDVWGGTISGDPFERKGWKKGNNNRPWWGDKGKLALRVLQLRERHGDGGTAPILVYHSVDRVSRLSKLGSCSVRNDPVAQLFFTCTQANDGKHNEATTAKSVFADERRWHRLVTQQWEEGSSCA
ncbi:hypothetical protein DFH09DRAFT_1101726 [Mycena vulgaris]|nr:hypothetical protein DFH09DRAFT_1101726 [Mycena vulgaris]